MSNMSWEYIAGFFDGEGCVSFNKRSGTDYYRIGFSIAQAEYQGEVLYLIKDFLTKNKIKSAIYRTDRIGNARPVLRLCINGFYDIKKFFENTLPLLVVKKHKALEAIKFCDAHMLKKPMLNIEEIEMILSMNGQKKTVRVIATAINRHYETVRDYLKKNGHERYYEKTGPKSKVELTT